MQLLNVLLQLVTLITFPLISLQLFIQLRQNRFERLTRLHQELLSDQMQQSIRTIFSNSHNVKIPTSDDLLQHIERVVNIFDLIGYRVKRRALPKNDTLETEWSTICGIWPKLLPFIQYQRELRNNRYYKVHFEWLYRQAVKYRSRNFGDVKLKCFCWEKVRNSRRDDADGEQALGEPGGLGTTS